MGSGGLELIYRLHISCKCRKKGTRNSNFATLQFTMVLWLSMVGAIWLHAKTLVPPQIPFQHGPHKRRRIPNQGVWVSTCAHIVLMGTNRQTTICGVFPPKDPPVRGSGIQQETTHFVLTCPMPTLFTFGLSH